MSYHKDMHQATLIVKLKKTTNPLGYAENLVVNFQTLFKLWVTSFIAFLHGFFTMAF
jgi:hypothetical protein